MIGLRTQPCFSWKRGLFASQSAGLYHHNALTKDKAQKNIEIQCPTATKTEKTTQRNFPTRLDVPPQADLAMVFDTASPALLHVSPATVRTNAMNDRHQHDSMRPPDRKVGTATTSNLKHDDGHIHRASPIRGLPPEHSKRANRGFDRHEAHSKLMTGLNRKQQGSIGNQAGNSALARPTRSTGDTGTDGRTFYPQTKQKGTHKPQAPLPQPEAPDRSEAVVRAIDERIDHKDQLQTTPQQPNPPSTDAIDRNNASLPTGGSCLEARLGDNCRSTDQVRPQKVTAEEPRVTRTRFSWHKGFLTTHKPPTRRMTPMSTQKSRSTSSNNLTNNIRRVVSAANCNGIQRISPREGKNSTATSELGTLIEPVEQRRLAPTSAEQTASRATFLQRYDVRVCLYGMNGEVYSEWEGLTNFCLQMQEFDDTIQILPWSVKDHNKQNPPLAISQIPDSFFDLHTYVPRLASQEAHWTTRMELGRTRHPYFFLSSSISPEELVNKMGPWL